ncbi:MAG: dihydropteroate synthase [Rhodospirillaceae bacterium]|nr:dihydropteroate synthase [Rhodospirillaceae bacterium]
MKINRSFALPRGFCFSPELAAEFQLRPIFNSLGHLSRGELFFPNPDGVSVVEASISDIKLWAAGNKPGLAALITTLIERVSRPSRTFAGLSLEKPVLMGVLNVTPDSFHDGGQFDSHDAAVSHGKRLINAGAEIVDIGGESTRPGAKSISVQEEVDRILPVIEQLAAENVLIAVDTRRAAVMREALAAGAVIVNDVTALADDGAVKVVKEAGAAAIIMHMQGTPRTMQKNPNYDNAPYEISTFLTKKVIELENAGLSVDRIAIDPGIGFGKTDVHNFAILRSISMLHGSGTAVVLGCSRKSFIGRAAGAESTDARLPGTIAATLHAVSQGAQIHRVHDVAEVNQALKIWQQSRTNI